MAIKFDRSWNSVLVQCTDCPHWFSLQLDQATAYRSAEGHVIRVHGVEPNVAETPRRLWERRHAEPS